MRTLHLAIMIIFQILLASFILYSSVTEAAAPPAGLQQASLVESNQPAVFAAPATALNVEKLSPPSEPAAPAKAQQKQDVEQRSAVVVIDKQPAKKQQQLEDLVPQAKSAVIAAVEKYNAAAEQYEAQAIAAQAAQYPIVLQSEPAKVELRVADSPVQIVKASEQPLAKFLEMAGRSASEISSAPAAAQPKEQAGLEPIVAVKLADDKAESSPQSELSARSNEAKQSSPASTAEGKPAPLAEKLVAAAVYSPPALEAKSQPTEQSNPVAAPIVAPATAVAIPQGVVASPLPFADAPIVPVPVPTQMAKTGVSPTAAAVEAPVVKGGLGPLHLLAATLCSSQPDKPVADETLNLLYQQRASLRKSLFEFMSLKFTNLEKLSSRLYPGLEAMPPKKADASSASGASGSSTGAMAPSHGWPLVGKCTAHDLKLMAEAAWCDCAEDGSNCGRSSGNSMQQQQQKQQQQVAVQASEVLDKQEAKILSNKHQRSIDVQSIDQLPEQYMPVPPAVISKLIHISDVKEAPVVESSIANLNLTQQQLAMIQVQATSTRQCRKNALHLTKALFNHLAEDQRNVSESWPRLYSQLNDDECARKRMIDIVTALSGFRGESTSIRRDNVEFAFAMDDLRAKVLESEVNVPLTFDKQFIEVEQFLQQSVKLMLDNIDPQRAKLTSMRYRSLMSGPMSSDSQCIQLHERLMATSYPVDCNPTQFGQLPDVLRMAANSLELWSIESEINKLSSKNANEYQASASDVSVNECIANLVVS